MASAGRRKRAANGEEIGLQIRLAAFDPLTQVATREIRALLWRDRQVIQRDENVLLERRYFRDELVAMLALAGFADVQVLGDYTDDAASPDSDVLVCIATRT